MITKYILVFMMILVPVFYLSYAEEEDEENPHQNMINDQFVCLDCHTDIPKEGETSPTYFLVDNPSENCLGCHDETQHPGTKEHIGQKAEPLPGDENGKISCFTCHDPHPQGVIEGRTVYEAELSARSRKFISLVVVPSLNETLGRDIKTEDKTEVYLREPANKVCISCHESNKNTDWRKHITWSKFTELFIY